MDQISIRKPCNIYMHNRYAICLCVDRNMLIPALFIGDEIKKRSAVAANSSDVIIFADASTVGDLEKAWMIERGILLRNDLEMSRFKGVAKLQDRLSVATLVKLVLAEHLADCYDKILYLDADISIHDDVTAIFALDTGEFALAAAPTSRRFPRWLKEWEDRFKAHARSLGMTEPYRYINTGVMLIDVAKWNKSELGERSLDFIRRNRERCLLPDEDALNAVLDGRQLELSPVWNMAPTVWRNATVGATVRPAIIHYHGPDKPWKRYGYGKRLLLQHRYPYQLYRDFVQGSPRQNWLREQWTWRDVCKNLLYEFRLASRRMRGRPNTLPTRRQEQADAEEFRDYCVAMQFADLDQGIVTREGGQLRLKYGKVDS
jgi:lipopolysaccharide biosynthesis glycosyltransferase